MLPTITVGSPLAEAIANVIPPKLVEFGWSEDGNDPALIEYVVLMLANGKSQEQIATELSNDLLGLEEGDTQALEFSKWLFGQVDMLNQQINGISEPVQAIPSIGQESVMQEVNEQDADMVDGASDAIPTGPRAMRGARQGRGRMLNQINKSLDRGDTALHRVQGQRGNGRIGGQNRNQNQIRGRGRGGRGGIGMYGNNMGAGMQMSPENQMQLMSMMEEQARMMSQLMPGFVPPAVNPAFQQNGGQQGRSLFDRVERQGGQRFNKRGPRSNGAGDGASADLDMDTTMDGEQDENSTCRFNLRCTKKDCQFAHQSPAAPEGVAIDVTDVCSFGAACKNRKCTGRHPSPAVKSAHQAEAMCKFFPHCTNPHCHFQHPNMPICRNGGDCKTEGCKFTHLQAMCKFNPCLNAHCPYKHAEGQRGANVWKAGGHVSDRKFVDHENGPEELIKPEGEGVQGQELAI